MTAKIIFAIVLPQSKGVYDGNTTMGSNKNDNFGFVLVPIPNKQSPFSTPMFNNALPAVANQSGPFDSTMDLLKRLLAWLGILPSDFNNTRPSTGNTGGAQNLWSTLTKLLQLVKNMLPGIAI